jgi:tetratricopeptide (TPR) repeat protein
VDTPPAAVSDQDQKTAQAKAKITLFHRDLSRRNHFQLLGVEQEYDAERLKANYHALAKRWHADAYTGLNLGPDKEKLDEIFQRISEAYEVLSDPKKKAEYLVLVDRQQKGLATDVHSVLRAEQLFDEALAQIRKREWATAKTSLEEAIKLNPDDQLYVANLAWVQFNTQKKTTENVKAVVDTLKKAIAKQENLPIAYQYLGQIFFSLEKFDDAKRWWKKCLEWEPGNVEASRGLRLAGSRAEQKKKRPGLLGLVDKLLGKG